MRTWVGLAALLLGVFAVSNASAQDQAPTAQSLIAAQHVDDLFTAVADAPEIVVRHNRSRLVCRFDPALASEIHVYNSPVPRGDDVSCGQNHNRDVVTFYTTRYAQPMTLDAAIAESVGEIMSYSPQAQPTDPDTPPDPLAPFESQTRTFVIPNYANRGVTVFSRTSVVVVDGWVYLMRFTAPEEDALASGRAEFVWRKFEADLVTPPEPGRTL